MYKRVTNKNIIEVAKIVYKYGYWNDKTRDFIENNFTGNAYNKINTILNSVYNSNNPKAAQHYNLIKEAGLFKEVKRVVSTPEQQQQDEQFIKEEYEKCKDVLRKCTVESYIDMLSK